MRVVLDTNVLVSGLLNPNGAPATILTLVLNERARPLYDTRIIQEYAEVLRREKFGFDPEPVDTFLDYVQNEGEFVLAEPTKRHIKDDDDRPFFEVLVSGNADYLVTGNKSHYPRERRVVSPREFLTAFGDQNIPPTENDSA